MKNHVTVEDLAKIVELIQKQNETVVHTLADFREMLKLMNQGDSIPMPNPGPGKVGFPCLTAKLFDNPSS